jgi:hypothetical protein
MNIAYTVCNRNSLANALTLGKSYLENHPDRTFYIGWADKSQEIPLPENIQIIQITDINIPDLQAMSSRYYDFEMVPASRPWFGLYLIKQLPQIKRLTFLSPTTYIYQKIDILEKKCKSMLLTPNILQPLPTNSSLKDRNILNIGMAHSGSWILKPNTQTISFLEWWSNRTFDRAKFDLCNGMCLDQLWLNYALSWIEGARFIDHPGWHTGLHSLSHHTIDIKHNTASGQKLISAEFTGLADFHPVWSDHKKLLNTSGSFRKLLKGYYLKVTEQTGNTQFSAPGYGIPTRISAFRENRKAISRQLRQITAFIDKISF